MSVKRNHSSNPIAATASPVSSLQVLTVAECADLLKISASSVYELTRFRRSRSTTPIPYRKVGKYIRFLRHEVEAWLIGQSPVAKTHKQRYTQKAA